MRFGADKLRKSKVSLWADERGAVAFELLIVYPFLLIGIMLPLADLAVASLRWIGARQALHAFGQSIIYSAPDDLANTSSWFTAANAKAAELDYPISNLQLICGDGGAACSSANTVSPKYYSFDTTVTLTPMVLSSVLCSESCTYTLSYSARFQ